MHQQIGSRLETGSATLHRFTELSDTYKLYFYSNRAYVLR